MIGGIYLILGELSFFLWGGGGFFFFCVECVGLCFFSSLVDVHNLCIYFVSVQRETKIRRHKG